MRNEINKLDNNVKQGAQQARVDPFNFPVPGHSLTDAPDKWDVHNRDHYVPNNATKYNTQGKFVPARKWYGIPKTYREGGTKYNELVREFIKTIEEDFKKISKLR